MDWKYCASSKSYPNGYWKPEGYSTSLRDQTAPVDSTHGAWSSRGDLLIVGLKDGDLLQRKRLKGYLFKRSEREAPIDGDYVHVGSIPSVQIYFQLKDKQLHMLLAGDQDDALVALARKTGSARMQMDLNGVRFAFEPDPRQRWEAAVDWNREQALPAEIALVSVVGNFVLPVSWKWTARSIRLVDQDGRTLYMKQMAKTPDKFVRIVFNTSAPSGLMFAQRWSLVPNSESASGEFMAAITQDTREITCREFLAARTGKNTLFTAAEYEPDVDTSAWIPKEVRCIAVLDQQGQVKPKQRSTESTVSFGPSRPYVIGSGEPPTGICVWDRNRFEELLNAPFISGSLPAPPIRAADFSELVLFIRQDAAEKVVAGIFKVAVDLPPGRWACRRRLEIRRHIVSWNGFIDEVDVSRINWNGVTRPFARFTNGFDLDPKLWFAAPFLGVATTEDSDWWGNAGDSRAATLARRGSRFPNVVQPKQWGVEGRWVEITAGTETNPGNAIDRYAEFLKEPLTRLMLFSGEDSAACSGPVLEVERDRKWPRVAGWLASTTGDAELSFGHITLASDGDDRTVLAPGEDLKTKQMTDRIRSALEKALQSPTKLEGECDGVYWRREGGAITAQEMEFMGTGLYVLTDPA